MPIRSLLVAVDLEEGSDSLLQSAAALATEAGAELHVVHSASEERLPYPGRKETKAQHQSDVEQAVREMLGPAASDTVPASVAMEAETPYRAITRRADAVNADAVIVGPHRRKPVGDRMMGSTADRVTRTATVPCLVLAQPLATPVKQMVVPLDFSASSRRALATAIGWANELGGSETVVEALHVVPDLYELQREPVRPEVVAPSLSAEVRKVRESTELRHGEIRETLLSGDVGDTILRHAEARQADLVVMSTHGASGLDRMLVGSVASKVLRHAEGSILLVPPEQSE